MGNSSSSSGKVAQNEVATSENMRKIQGSLNSTAKEEADGMVGCKNRKEAKKRQKRREEEFEAKQKKRSERTSLISQRWAQHRAQNTVRSERDNTSSHNKVNIDEAPQVEPQKNWYDE